jgi:outer membrane protein TolC
MRTWIPAALVAALLIPGGAALAQAPAPRVPLSLGDAVTRAAEQTAGVALAGLKVSQAEARVGQARSALLPNLSAAMGTSSRTFNLEAMGISLPMPPGTPAPDPLVGPVSNVDARLRLSQPLFDAAGYLRTRAAKVAVGGSEAERSVAAEAAASRAAMAYLKAERAQAVLAAREADVKLAAELLDLAETQLKAGVSTAIDVTRARTQKVAAEGQQLVAKNAAEQAQIDLARSLGMDPATRFALSDSLGTGAPAGVSAEQAVAKALSKRPELKQVAALGDAAKANRRAIQAERLPRLDVVADYGASGLNANDAIATRQVGIQVSVPLVDGLRRESRLAEQDAVRREVELRASDLRQQVSAEVQAALLDLENGRQQQAVAAERLRLAEEELSQARERFSNGVAGNIELINAQQSLNRARDAEIDARFATAAAQANLARAMGAAQEIR